MSSGMENEVESKQETLRAAVWRKLSEFCMYTSAHGYGRLFQAEGIIMRIFWLCVLTSVSGVFFWQLSERMCKFHKRPTKTIIKEITKLDQPFPQVTICNLNRIRKSKLPPEMLDLFPEILKSTAPTIGNASGSSTDGGIPGPDEYHPIDFLKEDFTYQLSKYDEDTLIEAGHQFDALIHSCTFKLKTCNWYTSTVGDVWTHFWHQLYGNCFTFNSAPTADEHDSKVLKTTNSGPNGGLSLELNIEQDEYIGKLSNEIGVQIQISSQGEAPFPYEKGISVPTGVSVKLGMKKVMHSRLDPFENKTCRDGDDIEDLGDAYRNQFIKYHPTACKLNCMAEIQRDNCSCAQYEYAAKTDNVCSSLNQTVAKCLQESIMLYEKGFCAELCGPSCREREFMISYSTAIWPSVEYEDILFSELQQGNITMTKAKLRGNMMKLSIYFKDLSVESIEETLSYDIGSFISDVGGIMGMFTGVSFLTCAEMLELLGIIVAYLLKRGNQRNQTGPPVVNVQPSGSTA